MSRSRKQCGYAAAIFLWAVVITCVICLLVAVVTAAVGMFLSWIA